MSENNFFFKRSVFPHSSSTFKLSKNPCPCSIPLSLFLIFLSPFRSPLLLFTIHPPHINPSSSFNFISICFNFFSSYSSFTTFSCFSIFFNSYIISTSDKLISRHIEISGIGGANNLSH